MQLQKKLIGKPHILAEFLPVVVKKRVAAVEEFVDVELSETRGTVVRAKLVF